MKRNAKTIRELAKLLPNVQTGIDGISPRTASEWKSRLGWKPGPKGYCVAECRRGILIAAKDQLEQAGDKSEKTALECQRLRVQIQTLEIERERAQMALGVEMGTLCKKSDIESEWTAYALKLKNMIDAWRTNETAMDPASADRISRLRKALYDGIQSISESAGMVDSTIGGE